MGVKKRRLRRNRLFAAVFIIVLLAMFGRNIMIMVRSTNRFALAQQGELSRTLEASGVILRAEQVIYAPASGAVSYAFRDGERVRIGSRIASVFVGDIDETLQIRLDRANERIEEYQASISMAHFAGGVQATEVQVLDSVRGIIAATHRGNMDEIPALKNRIYMLNGRRTIAEQERALASAIAERDELERMLGHARNDVRAASAGVFVSRVDGYERVFDVTERGRLVPSDLDVEFVARPTGARNVERGEAIGKIIDNFEWHFAGVFEERLARNFTLGRRVRVRFPSVSITPIRGAVTSINEIEDGRRVVVFTFGENLEGIHLVRDIEAEVILASDRGLIVPRSAIRVVDGERGVFIVVDDRAVFRRVHILQVSDNFVVMCDYRSRLMLHDEVITGGRGIEEGVVVR